MATTEPVVFKPVETVTSDEIYKKYYISYDTLRKFPALVMDVVYWDMNRINRSMFMHHDAETNAIHLVECNQEIWEFFKDTFDQGKMAYPVVGLQSIFKIGNNTFSLVNHEEGLIGWMAQEKIRLYLQDMKKTGEYEIVEAKSRPKGVVVETIPVGLFEVISRRVPSHN